MNLSRRLFSRAPIVLLVVLSCLAGWLLTTATRSATSSAADSSPVSTAGFPSGPGTPGIFTETCSFSHEAADDPILMPDMPGQSMQHDFFGNVSTGASSTADSLRGEATTCRTSSDSSAYWAPVLYQNGHAVIPIRALIYWERPIRATGPIHSVPVGLQMIAGDEMATHPQGVRVVGWGCAVRGVTIPSRELSPTPHSCPDGHLKLTVTFPSCWDGHTLSGKGQTNVVYLLRGRRGCPASHPVEIPRIVFHVIYPISSASGLALSMSPRMTGSVDTAHADFINAWRQNILDRDVGACLATFTRCGPVSGPGAVPQGPRMR